MTKAVERWKEEMPIEQEMVPRDKYTIFDRKEKKYRKSIRSKWPQIGRIMSHTDTLQNSPNGREYHKESTLLDIREVDVLDESTVSYCGSILGGVWVYFRPDKGFKSMGRCHCQISSQSHALGLRVCYQPVSLQACPILHERSALDFMCTCYAPEPFHAFPRIHERPY